ncbi:MAG: hypothetical protein HYR56_09375 [Acidobacteria bacterium]|nr:hypothetical protein [Acidobacteriota bacterium]MBI3428370.1 hypothetical protein [Acidobacteriota bacterium]
MTEPKVEMTPKAVDTRLRRVEQLRQLCLSLRRAKLAQAERRAAAAATGKQVLSRPT